MENKPLDFEKELNNLRARTPPNLTINDACVTCKHHKETESYWKIYCTRYENNILSCGVCTDYEEEE